MKIRLLLVFILAVAGLGFRMISPEEKAREKVLNAERHFGIREHAELYRYARITNEGEVFQGEMLIIFRYGEKEVNGVFRLLPDDDNEGVTLISKQAKGEFPQLSVYDHNKDEGGPVKPEELRQKLGDTDWFFEGVYDDDKNSWSYKNVGVISYRGQTVDVIQAAYTNPDLKAATGYDYRRVYIRQSDEAPMCLEFYDDGNVIYAIDLLNRDHFQYQGRDQIRTKQLQLIDYVAGSTTVLTRVRSNWNPLLPDNLYDLDFADDWDAETDAKIVSRLMRDNAAQVQ